MFSESAWPIGAGQNLWARDPQTWLDTSDPNEGVGSRHHTVPAFYLRYFADEQQLLVRRIADDAPRLCNLHDLAQKDFYTAVTDDPTGGPLRHNARLELSNVPTDNNAEPTTTQQAGR